MAILNNVVVNGSVRCLNKIYSKDLELSGALSVSTLTVSGLTTTNTLQVNSTSTFADRLSIVRSGEHDIGATSSSDPFLAIGSLSSVHLEFDNNEIMCKNGLTGMNPLYINYAGGSVYLSNGGIYASGNTLYTSLIRNSGTIITENMNVANTLRATRYDLQTIAQTGGSLYVSPTVRFPNNNTKIIITRQGTKLTLEITDSSITESNMAGIVWTPESIIRVSGEFDGIASGTMSGKIKAVNTNFLSVECSGENSDQIKPTGNGSITYQAGDSTYPITKIKNLAIACTHLYNSQAKELYRVGIWLNSYDIYSVKVGSEDQNSLSAIRIYGGTKSSPTVAIGNLTSMGLGHMPDGTTPIQGWGIYTDNGYFSGTVFSSAGRIGGWILSEKAIYKGTNSMTSTTPGLYLGAGSNSSLNNDTGIRSFANDNTYVNIQNGKITAKDADLSGKITATSGKIGKFIITDSYLYTYQDPSVTTAATECGMGGNQAFWAGHSSSASAPFRVSYGGALVATNATIEGSITAKEGMIAGFHITKDIDNSAKTTANGGHAYKTSLYRHAGNGTSYEYEIGIKGDSTENPSSANTSAGNLAFYITRIAKGNTWTSGNRTNMFYVTHEGYLYARNGGKISGWTFSSTQMYKLTAVTSGTASTQYGIMFNLPDSIGSTTDLFWAGSRPYDGGNKSYNGSDYGDWTKYTSLRADGTFKTTKGEIAGWNITSTYLGKGTPGASTSCILCPNGTNATIGNETRTNLVITAGSNFGVTSNGKLYCSDADIKGKVEAVSGKIAGWNMEDTLLYKDSGNNNYRAYLQAGKNMGASNAAFGIKYTDDNETVSYPFQVTYDGTLKATKANITGVIKASSGEIGTTATKKIIIGTNDTNASIYYNKESIDANKDGFYIGANGIALGKKTTSNKIPFKVTDTGSLECNSGNIANWIISDYILYKDNGSYRVYLQSPSSITNDTGAFLVRHTESDGTFTYPFYVTYSGSLVARKGNIGGWTIDATSFQKTTGVTTGTANTQYRVRWQTPTTALDSNFVFRLDSREYDGSTYGSYTTSPITSLRYDGTFTTTKADITGIIKARSGIIGEGAINKITIGSITVGNTTCAAIYSNSKNSIDSTNSGFYIGTNGIALGNNKFKVDSDGTITAKSGKIGSWDITDYSIKSQIINKYRVYLYAPQNKSETTGAIGVETINSEGQSTGQIFQIKYDGSILATKGIIAGWTLSSASFYKLTNVTVGTANQTQYQMFFNAPDNITNATTTRAFMLRKRTYNGSTYGAWEAPITFLNYDGTFTTTKADITGVIKARSGIIGEGITNKITIGSSTVGTNTYAAIYNGKTSFTTAGAGFYLGANGLAIGSNGLTVDSNGNVNIGGKLAWNGSILTIEGHFTATEGYIGGTNGFIINNTYITNGKTSFSENTNDGVYIGTDGIGLGKGTFYIDKYGKGSIGGWNITANQINRAVTVSNVIYMPFLGAPASISSTTNAFGIKITNADSSVSWPFTVTYGGKLTANNVDIKGKITATQGKISGWTIQSDQLYVGANIRLGSSGIYYGKTLYLDGQQIQFKNSSKNLLIVRNPSLSGSTYGDFTSVAISENKNGNVYANSSGLIYVSSSSRKNKNIDRKLKYTDIQNFYNLNVYLAAYKQEYKKKPDEWNNKYMPMFIAEEVNDILPQAAWHDENGNPSDWCDRVMIPVMFQMIKSQKEEIEQLKQLLKDKTV